LSAPNRVAAANQCGIAANQCGNECRFLVFVWAVLLVVMLITNYSYFTFFFRTMHDFCFSAPHRIAASASVEISCCFFDFLRVPC
jgi:hypothetical protein